MYERHPVRTLFSGVWLLLLLLSAASLPFLANDLVIYPAATASNYEGAALFFPFIIAYLFIGLPHLIFEQRRQMARLVERMNGSSRLAAAYDRVLLGTTHVYTLVSLVVGIGMGLVYITVNDMLFIDDLTAAANMRRVVFVLMPMLMWALYAEALRFMLRVSFLTARIIGHNFRSRKVTPQVFRPVIKIFSNNGLFVSFGVMGLPLLWFWSSNPELEVIVFAVLVWGVAVLLSWPMYRIWRMAKGRRVRFASNSLLTPFYASSYDPPDGRGVNGDLFVVKMFSLISSAHLGGQGGAGSHLSLVFLMARFWFIMLAPLVMWALVMVLQSFLGAFFFTVSGSFMGS